MAQNLRTPIACLAAGLLAGGGVALAAIPDSDGTVHLCYVAGAAPGTPNVRVVDPSTAKPCSSGAGETALDINQRGPAGPPGATGATGATGAAGPPGAASAESDAFEAVFNGATRTPFGPGFYTLPANGTPVTVSLPLPAGTYALFGKANLFSDVARFVPRHENESRYWVDSIPVRCTTQAAGDSDATDISVGAGGQRRTTAVAQTVHTFGTPGTATFSCAFAVSDPVYNNASALPEGDRTVGIKNLRLTAVKVRDVRTVTLALNAVSATDLTVVRARKQTKNGLIDLTLRRKPQR